MTARYRHPEYLPAYVSKALQAGGTIQPGKVTWPAAGRCSAPVYRELKFSRKVDLGREPPSATVEIDVPCRKCERCLKARAFYWRTRASAEIQSASRTWFGTLTIAPQHRFRAQNEAQRKCLNGGEVWASLTLSERTSRLHAVYSSEITRYMKRVRKASKAKLRVLFVAELHKNGDLHYHCLVHENGLSAPVRHKCLSSHWVIGFSNWKLVEDPRAASYVTKYLTKSAMARVRASRGYGITPVGIVSNHLEE